MAHLADLEKLTKENFLKWNAALNNPQTTLTFQVLCPKNCLCLLQISAGSNKSVLNDPSFEWGNQHDCKDHQRSFEF